MEYINAEQFLEQPEEVQKVFIEWWERNVNETDLIYQETFSTGLKQRVTIDIFKNAQGIFCIRPLFTEGQLRKFIEDKTGKCTTTGITWSGDRYIEVEEEEFLSHRREKVMDKDLLQAYWKYACRTAKEEP